MKKTAIIVKKGTFKKAKPEILVTFTNPNSINRLTTPFEIREKDDYQPKRKVKIQIQCSPEETTKLLKGQPYELFYWDDGEEKWKSSDKQIFVEYPTAKSVLISVTRFSKYKVKPFSIAALDDDDQDDRYSRNWDDEDRDAEYFRGGESYYLPVGFTSAAVKVKDFPEGECVAFHGTTLKNVRNICKFGFRLPPKVGMGHIALDKEVFGIPNFANAVFISPSYRLAGLYSVGRMIRDEDSDQVFVPAGMFFEGKILLSIIQCRVKKGSFTKNRNTVVVKLNTEWNDPHYDNEEIEWRIADPTSLVPYRVLRRELTFEEFENEFRNCNW